MQTHKKAFTLIELLMVIIVFRGIGVCGGVEVCAGIGDAKDAGSGRDVSGFAHGARAAVYSWEGLSNGHE